MATQYQATRDALLRLYDRALASARLQEKADAVEELTRLRSDLQQSRFTVAVIGEFKRGKSSLINNLLDLDEEHYVTPIDIDVATAVLIQIRYAPLDEITVHFKSTPPKWVKIKRNEIREYASESVNSGNSKGVSYIDVAIPASRLEDGLVIVDTPGVGGLDIQHSDVTSNFIPQADVIVDVTSAKDPPTKAELDLIRSATMRSGNATELNVNLPIFVVTKSDLVDDIGQTVVDLRAKLEAVLGKSFSQMTVVPVSNSYYRLFLKSGDSDDFQASNFDTLHKELWHSVGVRRAQDRILTSTSGLYKQVLELVTPVADKLRDREDSGKEAISKRKRELEAERGGLDRLTTDQADWYSTLSSGSGLISNRLNYIVEQSFIAVRHSLQQYANDPYYQENNGAIDTLLNTQLGAVRAQIEDEVSKEVDNLYRKLIEETGLPIGIDLLKFSAESKAGSFSGVRKSRGFIAGTFEIIRGAFIDSALGATFGSIFSPIGTAIGAVTGFFNGIVRVVKGWRKSDADAARQQILQHFGPHIDRILHDFRRSVRDLVISLESSLKKQLRLEIAQERSNLTTRIAAASAALTLSEQELAKEAIPLRKHLAELQALRRDVGDFSVEVRFAGDLGSAATV